MTLERHYDRVSSWAHLFTVPAARGPAVELMGLGIVCTGPARSLSAPGCRRGKKLTAQGSGEQEFPSKNAKQGPVFPSSRYDKRATKRKRREGMEKRYTYIKNNPPPPFQTHAGAGSSNQSPTTNGCRMEDGAKRSCARQREREQCGHRGSLAAGLSVSPGASELWRVGGFQKRSKAE